MIEETMPLRPRDRLLLLFDGARKPIDRVRIQKSMFLFAQQSKAPDHEKYAFEPYDYGPFSAAIYPDLERLNASDLIRRDESGRSPAYALTTLGVAATSKLAARVPAERLKVLQGIRDWVMARTFEQLLTDVYAMYPKFAVRSVFRKP